MIPQSASRVDPHCHWTAAAVSGGVAGVVFELAERRPMIAG